MRSHGEGSLFVRRSGRGKGRWVAVVTLRDGRRASRTAKTREEAKAALAELLRLRDARAPVTRNIRLSDYLERWVSEDHGLAPSTWRKHESIIRVHLIPRLGHVRLSELSPTDIGAALRGLRSDTEGLGARSVGHVRATLRRCLADALRDGLVQRNAAALAKPPTIPHKERTILDANQARVLIESTRNTVYGPLWTLLVTTGLRISEALGLSWSDVDFGGNDDRSVAAFEGRASGKRGLAGHGGSSGERGPVDAGDGGRSGRRVVGVAGGAGINGPSIHVRRQLARENGEWVHRPPKTAKGRRTIPLTPLGVEALRAQRTQQREWMAAYYGGSDGRGADSAGLRPHGVGGGQPRRLPVGEAAASPGVGGARPHGTGPQVQPINTLVFTTSRGKPLHETNTLAALHRDLAAAGLPRVTQHDLRHSCATLLYSMGVPLETIADILGHSTPRITSELYRHRVPELQQEAADAMQRALG